MADEQWLFLMSKHYFAPAKVNLHLAITDVREDGYHVLDTSFVYIDTWDIIHVEQADILEVSCSDASLDGRRNLVYTLLEAFQRKYHIKKGLHIFIDKKLPSQAGLGGGSSDAATALMVANQEWGINLSTDELVSFSAPFGADIPCFLFGQASYATGIGEKLRSYPDEITSQYVVVAWPGAGISTEQAFQYFDKNKFHALTEEKTAAKVRARSAGAPYELGYNNLEESAFMLCAPLKAMFLKMREMSERTWMSGSGSACVAICHSSEQAHELAEYLQDHGLATWVHVGHLLREHPLKNIGA